MMISQENFDESMPAMMNEHAVKRTVDDVSAEVTHTQWKADATMTIWKILLRQRIKLVYFIVWGHILKKRNRGHFIMLLYYVGCCLPSVL